MMIGHIYKVYSNNSDKLYIGSTCKTILQRFNTHKKNYHFYLQGKYSFVSIFKLFDEVGPDNCYIELICDIQCDSKIELHTKEHEVMQSPEYNRFIVNKNRPISKTHNELLEYKKTYYFNNKEKLLSSIACHCGGHYCTYSKSKHMKSQKHTNFIAKQSNNDNLLQYAIINNVIYL